MTIYSGIHSLIGETPLFEITRIPLPNNVKVYAKLEAFNPGGSVKDRLGQELIRDAINQGKITPKGTVIEPTAGNTGIGLALAAVGTELKVICVVPEKFSQEKQQLMRALGATIVNTSTKEGMAGAIAKTNELLKITPNSFSPAQFANAANPQTYYKTLGPELMADLKGNIDVFVAGAGTGGTFMGTANYLKEQDASIKTVIVEPEGSVLNGGESGPHRTEGIGMEFLPDFMDRSFFDDIHTITDREAFHMVRQLAQKEGLLVGSSSGAAFAGILREAEKAKEGATLVTVFPDSSERYLSTDIYMEVR
ncbi:cysteine synthase family protein [Salipaludibacillus agaradhaerens]|uniref:PLP-dependent cysteine synthase family protein n=1 Tax=Salipaludibacillus agaradhaerens TaxID=76935 RepID=UPI002151257C|nr:cysteine synthase family protein [Salipaludibacillus agaradhaerens]MCR6105166.1 cysteine synthase family protein [Salipaludibacillus agaradhaerens]MCR6117211.1 cysteine synthase family protein [Salipaludibacillus agaradhaerens]